MTETSPSERRLRARAMRLLDDERVRFLLVGGFNTVFGYAAFAVLYVVFGHVIGYLGSLYGAYVIAAVIAFTLHRRFTFRAAGTGSVFVDFLRFQGVYVIALAINTVALPLLVSVAHWPALIAQALIVVFTTLVSYFGHKYFSFRRGSAERMAGPPEESQ